VKLAINMAKNKEIGQLGERIAGKWLENHGYKVLDRNYWKKWGEIDIISTKDEVLHFVEVKSVTCADLSHIGKLNDEHNPEENVHPKKLQRLYRTIESYLLEKNWEGEWVLDVLAVYLDLQQRQAKVKILENIVG